MDRKQKINLVLCTFDHHIIIIKQQQTAPIKKQSDELIKVCFSGPLCKKNSNKKEILLLQGSKVKQLLLLNSLATSPQFLGSWSMSITITHTDTPSSHLSSDPSVPATRPPKKNRPGCIQYLSHLPIIDQMDPIEPGSSSTRRIFLSQTISHSSTGPFYCVLVDGKLTAVLLRMIWGQFSR